MTHTVVGLFDNFTTANKVVKELTAAGIRREDITVMSNETGANTGTTATTSNTTSASTGGNVISNFFSSLFGTDSNEDANNYTQAVQGGGAVVSVDVNDAGHDRVAEILNRHGAIDVDDRATQSQASAQTSGTTETSARTTEGGMAIPVIEEELRIGKRAVQSGGVRIINRVTERPVEETVTLREEHINVERRPVNRAVGDADLSAMQGGTIEVTEMAEEAVIAKEARVVEEIIVNKETVAREETIRDTVRRTDVEVEDLSNERARGKSTT